MIEYKNVDGYDLQNIKPSKVVQTDVLVVGAGNAGMMAAAAAKESGAQVVLIEKEKQLI